MDGIQNIITVMINNIFKEVENGPSPATDMMLNLIPKEIENLDISKSVEISKTGDIYYPSETHEALIIDMKNKFENTTYENISLNILDDYLDELAKLGSIDVSYEVRNLQKSLDVKVISTDGTSTSINIDCICLKDSTGTVKIYMDTYVDIDKDKLKMLKCVNGTFESMLNATHH